MEAGQAANELIRMIPAMFRWMSADMRCIDPCLLPAHMRVLGYLSERSGSLGELAERQGVTMATMSNTVGALLERGWVTRTVNELDRRKVTVAISPEGRELLKEIHARLELRVAEILSDFEPADLDAMTRILQSIKAKMQPEEASQTCETQNHFNPVRMGTPAVPTGKDEQ